MSAHTYFLFFRFCPHLPLPSTYRLTLSPYPGTACDFHSFLYHQTGGDGFRFACFAFLLNCWKQPFYISHFFIFCFPYENYNSFFLSVSFPRIRREVPGLRGDRGKSAYTGQNLNLVSFARFFTSFKNDRQASNTVLQKTPFYLSAHTCPFRQLTLTLSPTSGDSFMACVIFLFFIFTHIKNYNFFLP